MIDDDERFGKNVPYRDFILYRSPQYYWTIEDQEGSPVTMKGVAGLFTKEDKCREAIDAYLREQGVSNE
jgi:hypothetical protein